MFHRLAVHEPEKNTGSHFYMTTGGRWNNSVRMLQELWAIYTENPVQITRYPQAPGRRARVAAAAVLLAASAASVAALIVAFVAAVMFDSAASAAWRAALAMDS